MIEDKEKLSKPAPVVDAPLIHHGFVGKGKSCPAVGSAEAKAAFERESESRNLRYGKASKGRNTQGTVVLTDCRSVEFCSLDAAVMVYPESVRYGQVNAEIVEEHLIN